MAGNFGSVMEISPHKSNVASRSAPIDCNNAVDAISKSVTHLIRPRSSRQGRKSRRVDDSDSFVFRQLAKIIAQPARHWTDLTVPDDAAID